MNITLSRIIAFICLIIVAPIFVIIGIIILASSGLPIFYFQKRVGRNLKPFFIWKFRTMIKDASKRQSLYKSLNEADGPVFKIKNDPRFTKFGKWLSWSGLDELPQLINVIKGEMSLVGPRPLPIFEAENIPIVYKQRFSVFPGITSPWVIEGAHLLTFEQWMKSDLMYIKNRSNFLDMKILCLTVIGLLRRFFLIKNNLKNILGKLWKFTYQNATSIFIVIIGFILRYQRVVVELFWGEEAIYLDVARSNSIANLIMVRHWLIDHPQFYLLFLKIWSYFDTSPQWLRMPNLVIYLFSSYFVIKIGNLVFSSRYIRALFLSFYAIFPFFVGVEWQSVPYIFAMFFFLGTLYYLLKLLTETNTSITTSMLCVYLTLFLYTSFESIYFAASIAVFILFCYLFRLMSIERIKSLTRALIISGMLFVPEVLIVLYRIREFPRLASDFVNRGYSTYVFLSNLFLIPQLKMIYILGFCSLATYGLILLLIDKQRRLYAILMIAILVISFLLIYLISIYFFEIRHPRSYYYLIVLLSMMVLMIIDEIGKYTFYFQYVLIAVLLIFVGRYDSLVSESWLKGEYAFRKPYPKTIKLREELVKLLENDVNDESSLKLMLDNEIVLGNWYEGVYLYEYYLKCLDLENKDLCSIIQKSIIKSDDIDELVDNRIVGVFEVKITRTYYVSEICKHQKLCLLWDMKRGEFVKVAN